MSEVGPDSTGNPESIPTDPATANGSEPVAGPTPWPSWPPRSRPPPTTPAPSPSSRGSRRCASAPACTSARPVSAACTTWSGRSSTTPSTRPWPATPTPSTSPCRPTAAVRVVDNGRGIPTDITPGEGKSGRRGRAHPAARRRQVRRRRLHGLRWPARRRHLRGQRPVRPASTSRCASAATSTGRPSLNGVPAADLSRDEATDETGTTVTFWASPDIFETIDYDFETLRARFQQMAFLNKGLTITLTDERPEATEAERDAEGMRRRAGRPGRRGRRDGAGQAAHRVLPLRGRPGRLRQAPGRLQAGRAGAPARSSPSRSRTPSARCPSRSPCSGPAPTPSRCTPTPTPSTPTRAAPTRRASARR